MSGSSSNPTVRPARTAVLLGSAAVSGVAGATLAAWTFATGQPTPLVVFGGGALMGLGLGLALGALAVRH